MIDEQGFRSNVGMILTNGQGKVLWARRIGSQHAWQFPQGGINDHETPVEAMYRELKEELGMLPTHVQMLAETKQWLCYRLPKRFQRRSDPAGPVCIGQKQKWFLLSLVGDENCIKLSDTVHPEFDAWRWVSYWYPIKQVIYFKRHVYRQALEEFAPLVIKKRNA